MARLTAQFPEHVEKQGKDCFNCSVTRAVSQLTQRGLGLTRAFICFIAFLCFRLHHCSLGLNTPSRQGSRPHVVI
jgi:hypothetical protein